MQKCTRRCISIDKTPLLTLCCQNVVVMIANFLRCVHQRHFLPGLGLGAFSSWSDNMVCRVFMVVGKKYDMICLLNVHVQCIWMHSKHTTHHYNDKSVWLWISGYDMLLIWIGFKSSKRNVMRYTCYVSSFCDFLLSFKTALMKLPLHHGISLCCFCIWKI